MNLLLEIIFPRLFIKVERVCYSMLFISDWSYNANSSLNHPGIGRQTLYRAAINQPFNLFNY